MNINDLDPTGLIRESYRIEGIHVGECRSIFLDWAIKLPQDTDNTAAITLLLATYSGAHPDHPMTSVLKEGLGEPMQKGRRGGRKARLGS